MIDLLRTLIEPLVENQEAIDLRRIDNGDEVVLEVRVAEEDMGRVIGRRGSRAQAIRTIMKAKGKLENKRVIVDIVD